MSDNIGNNDSMAQGAENGSGVSSHRHSNVIRPHLSPELLLVIPKWMQPRVRLLSSENLPTALPIIYEISLDHYDRDETTEGTSSLEGESVEDNRVKRLETIIEE